LHEALEQELLLQPRHTAMVLRAGDLAHAVPADRRVSVCGLEVVHMVAAAEDFATLPPSRRCPDCVRTLGPSRGP
jgi:hypothetical protein